MSANQIKELTATVEALTARVAALEATLKTTKKTKTGEPRAASEGVQAWKATVEKTVADMRANGWESWTDVSGNVFAGSKPATIDGRATHVFTDSGKEPAYPIGLKRASYLKTKDSPEELAKTKARADKRAATVAAKKGSVGKAETDEPVADEPKAEKPKRVISDEQKAKMKAGREAKAAEKKAAKEAKPEAKPEVKPEAKPEVAEVAEAKPEAKPEVAEVKRAKTVIKKAKVYDLTFNGWTFNGEDYISNERGDVLTMEGDWVGRFDGKVINETVERPTDIDEFLTLE
jgi:hypothetical protein